MRLTGARLLIFLFVSLSAGVSAQENTQEVERFALIVGANDGGANRITLRYAADDARAVANVLEDLGGVPPKNRIFLIAPDRREFIGALDQIETLIAAASGSGRRVELIFYYSGHSDEFGLLLSGHAVGYGALKARINAMVADVKVVILDSCASGAMTRRKGGRRIAPFMADSSVQLKGHAYLTSTAEDEAAQESDKIAGSFFTHYFVSGLRGAADMSNDGRVTLNEAYHFTFTETLGRTEATESGAQHASYDISLTGSGDLVLTDLRETSAALSFAEDIEGRLYVRDSEGQLAVELSKTTDRASTVGLEPGDYRAVLDRRGEFFLTEFRLGNEQTVQLSMNNFVPIDSESTIARGLGAVEKKYTHVVFNIGLFPPVEINKAFDEPILNNVSLSLLANEQDKLQGLALTTIINWQNDDMEGLNIAGITNVTQRDAKGVALAGAVNYIGRDVTGLQLGAFYNHTERHFTGLQLGLVDYTGGNFTGAQLALVDIAVGNFKGGQIGLLNITVDNVLGAQLALANLTIGNVKGGQFSLASWTQGDVVGGQFALSNITTGTIRGGQVAYLNITSGQEESHGAQIGFLNVNRGKLRGTQIGFVNYADYVDVPIGVISIIPHGMLHGNFWISDTAVINAGMKMGGKYVYNIFSVGYQPLAERQNFVWGYGLGGHIPINNDWFLDIDVMHFNHHDIENFHTRGFVEKLRLIAGWQFHEKAALIFGPALNLFWRQDKEFRYRDVSYLPGFRVASDIYLAPGFMTGFQI